jgi:hypothetical protein
MIDLTGIGTLTICSSSKFYGKDGEDAGKPAGRGEVAMSLR